MCLIGSHSPGGATLFCTINPKIQLIGVRNKTPLKCVKYYANHTNQWWRFKGVSKQWKWSRFLGHPAYDQHITPRPLFMLKRGGTVQRVIWTCSKNSARFLLVVGAESLGTPCLRRRQPITTTSVAACLSGDRRGRSTHILSTSRPAELSRLLACLRVLNYWRTKHRPLPQFLTQLRLQYTIQFTE